jgi:hypothetical protein
MSGYGCDGTYIADIQSQRINKLIYLFQRFFCLFIIFREKDFEQRALSILPTSLIMINEVRFLMRRGVAANFHSLSGRETLAPGLFARSR